MAFHVNTHLTKKPPEMSEGFILGAFSRDRTGDLILTMDALYLLSYEGTLERVRGIEPP